MAWLTSLLAKPPLPPHLFLDDIEVKLVVNQRAKRMILAIESQNGQARLTLPPNALLEEGQAFLRKQQTWLRRQIDKLEKARQDSNVSDQRSKANLALGECPIVYLHGEAHIVEAVGLMKGLGRVEQPNQATDEGNTQSSGGMPRIIVAGKPEQSLMRAKRFLRQQAEDILSKDCWALYQTHQALLGQKARKLNFVQIKAQKSRWGSCSSAGRVNLNWRLIQFPPSIRHYVICHELAHLAEMNHSAAFWQLVDKMVTNRHRARHWLRTHAKSLMIE